MAGIVKASMTFSADHGSFQRSTVGKIQDYLQTNPGGGVPGAVDVTVVAGGAGQVLDLSALTTPGFIRLENLSEDFDVFFGPFDGVALEPIGKLRKVTGDGSGGILYGGGVAMFEVDPALVVNIRLAVETAGPARVMVECMEF